MTISQERAKAREQIERQTAKEARGYGGRRVGFVTDEDEHARRLETEERLLDLARRAIRKNAED